MLNSAIRRTAVAVVLLLACATLSAESAGVSKAGPLPREIADCKVFKLWQFSKSAEGWRPGANVGPFSVKNGVLSFRNTGPDPGIVNMSPGAADCSRYGRLGIMMRSSVGGSNQVYFGTSKSVLGGDTVATCSLRGDGKYHFCEVDLSQIKTWNGKLTVLRIDPVNGTGEADAKVDIAWIALYQVPARIELERPEVADDYDVGGYMGTSLGLFLKNVGGQSSGEIVVATPWSKATLESIPPGESTEVQLGIKNKQRGYTVIGHMGSKTAFVVGMTPREGTSSQQWKLGDATTLILDRAAAPDGKLRVCGGRLLLTMGLSAGSAVSTPLATLVYKDRKGVLHYDEITPESGSMTAKSTVTLQGRHKLADGSAYLRWTITARDQTAGSAAGDITCEFSADTAVDILRFEGPQLRTASVFSHALFPGLQYLEANEPYTAAWFIGPKLADQHIPHPHKIAVPLMAIETKDGVIGMSWDPLQQWAPGHSLPCAQFEPNEGLMTIFAPSIPDYVDENHECATTPYTLKPGQKMTLKMSFFTEAGRKITDVIPDYLASHPIKCVLGPGDVEKAVDTCFKAYTGTLYSNGWKNHIGAHLPYVPNGPYAALVLGESLRKSDPELARKCNIDQGTQLAQYTGVPLDWFTAGAHAAVDEAIARQSADGGFPYTVTEEMSERIQEFKPMSGVDATTLGTVGETNSGLIARELGAILDLAVRIGAKKYVDAGLLGLAKLNTFTVPRGAQTWEVHANTPDVYAAALCVNANIAGYQLTLDEKYLDYAGFWARTGLPFIYTWVPPISQVPAAVMSYDENGEGKNLILAKPGEFYTNARRQINPGASIAVFGTSFYIANWFGNPVQWCGLVWANAARAYTKLRPDAVLQSVADSVFASATQQQFDKGFAAGTYPDAWNLISNTVSTAFIAPDQIISYAYGRLGEKTPATLSTEGFKLASGTARLNTFAFIERLTSSADGVEATLKLYADQDVYGCFVPVRRPASVKVDGRSLAAVELRTGGDSEIAAQTAADLRTAASGFYYDAEKRTLHVKYRSKNRRADLKVEWK